MEAESGGGGGAFDPLPVLPYRPPPMHVGEGLLQGGERVWRGVKEGITGIVVRPMQGAREDGVPGFLVGLGRGAVGAVAAPVAAVFGAVSAVSEVSNECLVFGSAMSQK